MKSGNLEPVLKADFVRPIAFRTKAPLRPRWRSRLIPAPKTSRYTPLTAAHEGPESAPELFGSSGRRRAGPAGQRTARRRPEGSTQGREPFARCCFAACAEVLRGSGASKQGRVDELGFVTAARGACRACFLRFAVRRSHLAKPDGTQVPQGAPHPSFPCPRQLSSSSNICLKHTLVVIQMFETYV